MLSLVTAPDPVLSKPSLNVKEVDDSVRGLMDGMLEVMYKSNGIGLAAVQVGVLQRVLVLDLSEVRDEFKGISDQKYPIFMANPRVLKASEELVVAEEGCLSLPEQAIEVARPEKITIEFLDYNNKKTQIDAEGWLSRAIQHEMDHLDGKLLIDYLTYVKRDVALRKLTKLKNRGL